MSKEVIEIVWAFFFFFKWLDVMNAFQLLFFLCTPVAVNIIHKYFSLLCSSLMDREVTLMGEMDKVKAESSKYFKVLIEPQPAFPDLSSHWWSDLNHFHRAEEAGCGREVGRGGGVKTSPTFFTSALGDFDIPGAYSGVHVHVTWRSKTAYLYK